MTKRYIPALAYRWLTPLYDPVVRLTTREGAFKAALLEQANLQSGARVLDLACGTATLTVAAKRLQPGIRIVGLDGDPEVLARARAKAAADQVDIQFDEGLSHEMPYEDASFDAVLCSLFFHHIDRDAKLATLQEIRRVLRPGGELHVADWGGAQNLLMRALFLIVQLLDGFETTADNVAGRLPEFMRDSGLVEVAETRRFATPLGTISLYRAMKQNNLSQPGAAS